MAKNSRKIDSYPNPLNTRLDGKVASVGDKYPDDRFTNPFNASLDEQYPYADGDSPSDKTLFSPTRTPVGMDALELNGLSDYDSNWEHGVRGGIEKKPKGPRESERWTPRGGKR